MRGARRRDSSPREQREPLDSVARLSLVVGWLVCGLGPLLALALAFSMSAPSTSARAAGAYGLIIIVLAVVAAAWGTSLAIVALGEGVLGLIALLLKGRSATGALDGWLVIDTTLLVIAAVVISMLAVRLHRARREVARLKLAAARERAQADAALDAAPDALVFFDQTGRVARLNQEARRLFASLRLDESARLLEPGAIWMRAGHPMTWDDSPGVRALRGELIREEILAATLSDAATGPARRMVLAVSAAPILGPDGIIAGAVVSARDVSEAATERAPREWPSLWMERIDTFIGMASHELRTPLTTIKASVQLGLRKLSRTSRPELIEADLRQLLTRADQQVGRMSRLIEELLDTSRIVSNRMTLRFERCDLLALTREAVRDAQLRAPARTIWLETDGEPAFVWGDPARLAQVIGEYISNALKFSDASQPVEVYAQGRWRVRAPDGPLDGPDGVERWQARISVRDHGPGVKREDLGRVWDRFYQDPELVARVGSEVGLGLGLGLCRAIIEAHHGAVGVESDGGALFWLTLPRLPA